jgi:hypothetical protein
VRSAPSRVSNREASGEPTVISTEPERFQN